MTILNRRALLAVSAALIFLPAAVLAQNSTPPSGEGNGQGAGPENQRQRGMQARQRQEAIASKLGLTDDQKQQWRKIQMQTAKEARTVRGDNSLSAEQKQAKMKEIRKQSRQQIMAVLSPEQQQELKKLWEEQRQKKQNSNSSDEKDSGDDDDGAQTDGFFAGMVQDPAPAQKPPK